MSGAARVWLLTGRRRGDAAQARALAEDLGLPWRELRLDHGPLRELPNALLGASLASLRARPEELVPPWPDLVIGVGRRTVPAARWIRWRSGHRTRLVQIGRPRAPLHWFDLVLSTPQYGLPDAPNVVRLALPWQAPLSVPASAGPGAHVLAVLGGDSWSVRLGDAETKALAGAARTRAETLGLPVGAIASPRTPATLAALLRGLLRRGDRFHDFATGEGNPYRDLLSAAAEVVVTGDSASGLAEAAWTGRPVAVVPVRERAWLRALDRMGGSAARGWRRHGGNLGLGAPPPRVKSLHESLVARGLAHTEGGLLHVPPCRPILEADRRIALDRIRDLIFDLAAH